jgi:hypothetical protein
MGIKEFINRPLKQEAIDKVLDYKLNLNNEVNNLKEKINQNRQTNIDLNLIERFSRFIYVNPNHIAKIEALQYVIFIVILYIYNPLNIKSNYPVFSKLLVLIVAFVYVVLFCFLQSKLESGDDVDLIPMTEKNYLKRVLATIVFFILFILALKGLLWLFVNTQLIDFLRVSMSFIAVIGVLGIIYYVFKKTINKAQNAPKKTFWSLLLKIIMYLPCLLVDIVEYVKYEFNLTSKPIWMLLGIEASVIGIWFIVPFLFSKLNEYGGLKLLNKPVNLNKEYDIGDFNKLYADKNLASDNDMRNIDQYYSDNLNEAAEKHNKQLEDSNSIPYTDPNIPDNKILAKIYNMFQHPVGLKMTYTEHPQYTDTNSKRFSYKYSLSGWFYINPQPPNTRSAYTRYTNILKYGNKVNIEYNGQLNSLRVMTAVAASGTDPNIKNKSVEVFETKEVLYQKWNYIVVNYDNGIIDVFLNGLLMGTKSGVAPYMSFDTIVAGATEGIEGGICNVVYYSKILKKSDIALMYKTLSMKNMPYIWSMNDDSPTEKGVQRRKINVNDELKKFFRIN